MKIYVDVIFLINLTYDFLILNMVNLILRRRIKNKRIILSSFVGSFSSFSIFFPIFNNIYITIFLSILMVIICFSYKDIIYFKNNILYFYMVSVIFGGMLYMFNIKLGGLYSCSKSYEKKIFINFIGIIVAGIITYFYYLYLYKNNKIYHENYYKLDFSFGEKLYSLNAFYDTGNLIKDPYKGRIVILINEDILYGDIKNKSPIYVPFKTINSSSLIKCYKPRILIINDKVVNNCLVGLFSNTFFKDNVNAIISGYLGDYIR